MKSEEGSSGSDPVKRKKVKSDLVEINHLVRRDMKASYSNAEPDVGSEVLEPGNDAVLHKAPHRELVAFDRCLGRKFRP